MRCLLGEVECEEASLVCGNEEEMRGDQRQAADEVGGTEIGVERKEGEKVRMERQSGTRDKQMKWDEECHALKEDSSCTRNEGMPMGRLVNQ